MNNSSFVEMEKEESANFFDIVKLTKERANEKKNEEFSTKINRKVSYFLNSESKKNLVRKNHKRHKKVS